MKKYDAEKFNIAIDCIIFGFDGEDLNLLVIKRGIPPCKGDWSLIGGFVSNDESAEQSASRILSDLTGLSGIYMEQLYTYSKPNRDPIARTIAITYFALIDIQKFKLKTSDTYHPQWFKINDLPTLIFDHNEMVALAKERLQYKAAQHPLLMELLPKKFTIPQLKQLYEQVYDIELDKGNFNKKINSTGLLIKLEEKDKLNSKKGAFYYKIDKKKYKDGFKNFLNFVPKPKLGS